MPPADTNVDNNGMEASSVPNGESVTSSKRQTKRQKKSNVEDKMSKQEAKEIVLAQKKKKEVHIQFEHLLKSIIQKPEVFKKPEMQYLREFVTTVESNREKYPKVMGDKQYNEYIQSISDSSDKDISLTAGYIEAISRGQDTSSP